MARWFERPTLWVVGSGMCCSFVLGYKIFFLSLHDGACDSDSFAFEKQIVFFFKMLAHVLFMGSMICFEKQSETRFKTVWSCAFFIYDMSYLSLTGTNYYTHCGGFTTDFAGTLARVLPYTLTTLILYWSTVYEPETRKDRHCLHFSHFFYVSIVIVVELLQMQFGEHESIAGRFVYDYFNVKTAITLFEIYAGRPADVLPLIEWCGDIVCDLLPFSSAPDTDGDVELGESLLADRITEDGHTLGATSVDRETQICEAFIFVALFALRLAEQSLYHIHHFDQTSRGMETVVALRVVETSLLFTMLMRKVVWTDNGLQLRF